MNKIKTATLQGKWTGNSQTNNQPDHPIKCIFHIFKILNCYSLLPIITCKVTQKIQPIQLNNIKKSTKIKKHIKTLPKKH
mgnify:CR=1 FL=1